MEIASKNVFLKAAIIAIFVFLASIGVGFYIESEHYAKAENQLLELQEGADNSLLFSLFLRTHTQNDSVCKVLKAQVDESAQTTYNLYGELEDSKSTSVFNNYAQLRKKYFLANMRFYLTLKDYALSCKDESLKPVLFFYNTRNDCPACAAQGQVLDQVRNECPNARVYAFPTDIEDLSMIRAFKTYYSIKTAPTLVINDKTYDSLVSKQQIKQAIGCK